MSNATRDLIVGVPRKVGEPSWGRQHAERKKGFSEQGLCMRCSKVTAIPNRTLCPTCRDRTKAWDRDKLQKLRTQFLQMYGGACTCCGEENRPFLTLDHVRSDGAQDRRKRGVYAIYRRAVKTYDPTTHQILCFNCNCGRAQNGGICPHQEAQNE